MPRKCCSIEAPSFATFQSRWIGGKTRDHDECIASTATRNNGLGGSLSPKCTSRRCRGPVTYRIVLWCTSVRFAGRNSDDISQSVALRLIFSKSSMVHSHPEPPIFLQQKKCLSQGCRVVASLPHLQFRDSQTASLNRNLSQHYNSASFVGCHSKMLSGKSADRVTLTHGHTASLSRDDRRT